MLAGGGRGGVVSGGGETGGEKFKEDDEGEGDLGLGLGARPRCARRSASF